MRKLTKEEAEQIFSWLNEADARADAMYEAAIVGKRLSARVTLSGHAHRVAGSISAIRHTIEAAAGMELNSSVDSGKA